MGVILDIPGWAFIHRHLSTLTLYLFFSNQYQLFISQFFTHRLNVNTQLSFSLLFPPFPTIIFLSLSLSHASYFSSSPLCVLCLLVSALTCLTHLPLNLAGDSWSFAGEFVFKSWICLPFHILISSPAPPCLIFSPLIFPWIPLLGFFFFLQLKPALLPSAAPPTSASSLHPPSP